MWPKKRDKLKGWENVLRKFGYQFNPVYNIWINDKLRSAWTEESIRKYFTTTRELEQHIIRYRDDLEMQKRCWDISGQIRTMELNFLDAEIPDEPNAVN